MNLSTIAARLRKVAFNIEIVTEKQDYDWPEEMVLPLITNAFTDDNTVRALGEIRLEPSGATHPKP